MSEEKILLYKKMWVSIVALAMVLVMLTGCGGKDSEPDVVENKEPNKVAEQENQPEDDSRNKILEGSVLSILEESFSESGDIDFNEEGKIFTVTPTEDSFVIELSMAVEGNQEAIQSWYGLVNSFKAMSESISETLPGYAVGIVNPLNINNFILMAQDGVIIYNVLEE